MSLLGLGLLEVFSCQEKGWKWFCPLEMIGNHLPSGNGRGGWSEKWLVTLWFLRRTCPFQELCCLSPFLSNSLKDIPEQFGGCIFENLFLISQILNVCIKLLQYFLEAFSMRVIAPDRVDMASYCYSVPEWHASSGWTNGPTGSRTKACTLSRACSKAIVSHTKDEQAVLKTESSLGHLVSSKLGTWNIPLNLCLSTWGSVEVKDFLGELRCPLTP